jgi:integrase
MTISPGHRCDATQALRQVLGRAVVWGMIDSNPAKQGIDNPQRRRTEKRPFESWAQLDELAARLGSRYGPPVLFAAATGLRLGEWMALEQRDIDRQARVVYVRRALRNGRLKSTKTEGSIRAVPLQAIAQRSTSSEPRESQLLFRRAAAVTSTSTTSATATGHPAQIAAGIVPSRRVYDLRHTFATFAPRRRLNLRPLALHGSQPGHDRPPYGHLARDGREHAIRLLDGYADIKAADVQAWTSDGRRNCPSSPIKTTETAPEQEETESL